MGKKVVCIFCALTTVVLISCEQKSAVTNSTEANQEWHHHGGDHLHADHRRDGAPATHARKPGSKACRMRVRRRRFIQSRWSVVPGGRRPAYP